MSLIRDFFIWLEEHQVGILTTIAIHLFVFTAFLALKISTVPAQEFAVFIDLSQYVFEEEEIISEENLEQKPNVQEFIQNMRQEIPNIPVNVADRRAEENVERMIREVMEEENISTLQTYRETPETTADDDIAANIYDDDTTGRRAVHTGPTTVSYELTGRHHTSMPPPVYRCRSGGTVVVDIAVNNNGYVIKAEINISRSNSGDNCLINTAKSYAERSRFNRSTTAVQQGTITYVFQAQ